MRFVLKLHRGSAVFQPINTKDVVQNAVDEKNVIKTYYVIDGVVLRSFSVLREFPAAKRRI